ncbi:MAG: hypothetical protein OCC49_18935 [Fibrobacterales bacterium]
MKYSIGLTLILFLLNCAESTNNNDLVQEETESIQENTTALCSDGLDNNQNNKIDCEDYNCFNMTVCTDKYKDGPYCQKNPDLCGYFLDSRDSNEYKWVNIGSQVWMGENLAYIPEVSHVHIGSELSSAMDDSYYYVYDFPEYDSLGEHFHNYQESQYYLSFGVLYNWNAAMKKDSASNLVPSGVQGVCPDDWHLPSKDEWDILAEYIDQQLDNVGPMSDQPDRIHWEYVGGYLQAQSGWRDDNFDKPDSTRFGFSALPSGVRSNAQFDGYMYFGYWWTSSEFSKERGWYRLLASNGYLQSPSRDKSLGMSVRCLKN